MCLMESHTFQTSPFGLMKLILELMVSSINTAVCTETMLGGSLSSRHGVTSGYGWRLAANILNKQPRTNDKGWSSSLGVGRGANNPSP
jgi:hypothetical protein